MARKMGWDRRRSVAGLLGVIALAGCTGGGTQEAASGGAATEQPASDPATEAADGGGAAAGTVISYNSPEDWANWGGVLDAFSEDTGIEAPNDPKNSGQTIAALQAEAAAPVADTAYYGIVFGYQAEEEGLVEPYVPAHADEVPDALKDPEGAWTTVHQGAVAFLVNTDELGDAEVPRCWEDLTDPAYEGIVGYLDPTQAAVGYSVLAAANLALGGDLEDWDPGIVWAQAMRDNGVVNPAQTATSAVQQGEIPILIDADFNGYQLAEVEGAPIEVVYPCEGSLAIPYVMSLVAGAPHPENGKALIDFALSDEGQSLFAESYIRPVRDVALDPEVAAVLPDAQEYDELVETPDFAALQAAQADAVARYSAEVAG